MSREDNSRLCRDTSPSLALDLALVGATTDAEVTLLTPVGVPGVSAEPVLDTIAGTVAEHLNSMSTLIATAGVVIDTAGVAHEISINLESNLDGTVSGDLGLDVGLTRDSVGLGTLVLIASPGSTVLAGLGALGSDRGVDTGGVRAAGIRDDTSLNPVLPGAARIATIAITAGARAAEDILRRKTKILAVLDIVTIAHSLSSTEGPAGTALTLVTDVLHGGAARPLGAGIEALRGIVDLFSRVDLPLEGVEIVDTVKVDTKEATSLALGHTSDVVVSSPPVGLDGVDLVDHLGANSDLLSEGHCSDNSKCIDELHCR